MTISNSNVPQEGDTVVGKRGTYILHKKLGHGGNGTVYEIEINEGKKCLPKCELGYVIKILTIDNIINKKEREKRSLRFKREIMEVHKVSSRDLGIIPIFDSYIESNSTPYEWYLMPRAEKYRYSNDIKPIIRLKEFRQLGSTIYELHQKGIFHRDIKPDNILYYNQKCCLTDFGLVWNIHEGMHITECGEALGPVAIRPPEMDGNADRLREAIDYQKVDVYLFVKTLWIILTGNHHGFRGEYSRSDQYIYLSKDDLLLGETIEPLHRMMEEATKHNNLDRITIEKCLEYIDLQIDIAEGIVASSVLNSLVYDESMSAVRSQVTSDADIFCESEKIFFVLSKMESLVEIVLNDFGEDVSLGILKRVEIIDEETFKLNLDRKFVIGDSKRNIRVYVRIGQMAIGDKINEIKVENLNTTIRTAVIIHNVGDLRNCLGEDIGLDMNCQLYLRRAPVY